ncbi:MgtC/SapB family protein [Acaryochloris sp. IP29b_bin.148]|uniref:MgtC/SapB family protein n=1 Tax=Acaryochloris sp. IP29b_bin.148 TaxID=2969218 RepID=UPI00261F2B67|nr:MgtC/SapB family protein [Acaryochloris sp. IP29b_bin.148]
MTWIDFGLRLTVALILGSAIGIERQWRQTRAVLKTNVLVCIGSSMFVMMSMMHAQDSSPTRVAAQIVSGVGFLGGGVILREGTSVRGLNTAATLWCSASIGTLVGGGFLFPAYLGAAAVVFSNLVMRPLVEQLKFRPHKPGSFASIYRFVLICETYEEKKIRNVFLDSINTANMMLRAWRSESLESLGKPKQIVLEIELMTTQREDMLLDHLAETLQEKANTQQIRWELVSDRIKSIAPSKK